jgi:mono/diheme cytochrome c family protein
MTARRLIGGIAILCVVLAAVFPHALYGNEDGRAQTLIHKTCAGCHRFEGAAESRFKLSAPDLMWAGSKYQRAWVIDWLTGKEEPLYPKGYRWDITEGPTKHMTVSKEDAEAIADYFERHLIDPRVTVGAFNLSTFSAMEAEFGRKIYRDHACIGCHQIEEHSQIVGGPQSVSLVKAGRRYNADWLYRFGMNPQDFNPHSGEFLADASSLGLRYVIGYVAIQGVPDVRFAEPWKSEEFGRASVDRGMQVYKEYCMQCHGATGRGDGPAVSGLDSKPAVHANMAFEKLPPDYVYNVIYYGGRSMGKSAAMPYWGLTIGQQGVADVMAYLNVTFKGLPEIAGTPSSGSCVQPRKTVAAPAEYAQRTNPLPATPETIQSGKSLFLKAAQPIACAFCHGDAGDGKGLMGMGLIPPPRNFTCGAMMNGISDGQLYWIIKNGSPGTGMPPFASLADEQVWQLVRYIRSLAK